MRKSSTRSLYYYQSFCSGPFIIRFALVFILVEALAPDDDKPLKYGL